MDLSSDRLLLMNECLVLSNSLLTGFVFYVFLINCSHKLTKMTVTHYTYFLFLTHFGIDIHLLTTVLFYSNYPTIFTALEIAKLLNYFRNTSSSR